MVQGQNTTLYGADGLAQLDAAGKPIQVPCGSNATTASTRGLAGPGQVGSQPAPGNQTYPNASHDTSPMTKALQLDGLSNPFSRDPSRVPAQRIMVGAKYYEFVPGQIKLADFAKNGERCPVCLTEAQIAVGKTCAEGTTEFIDSNSACTSDASLTRVAHLATVALLTATLVLVLSFRRSL